MMSASQSEDTTAAILFGNARDLYDLRM